MWPREGSESENRIIDSLKVRLSFQTGAKQLVISRGQPVRTSIPCSSLLSRVTKMKSAYMSANMRRSWTTSLSHSFPTMPVPVASTSSLSSALLPSIRTAFVTTKSIMVWTAFLSHSWASAWSPGSSLLDVTLLQGPWLLLWLIQMEQQWLHPPVFGTAPCLVSQPEGVGPGEEGQKSQDGPQEIIGVQTRVWRLRRWPLWGPWEWLSLMVDFPAAPIYLAKAWIINLAENER